MRALFQNPRRLLRNQQGVVAIEFALLGPIFFLFLFAIMETALLYGASVVLDGAVNDSARAIRTGQAQQSDDPIATFRDQLCSSLLAIVPCDELTFDVRTFDQFSSIVLTVDIDEDGILIDENGNPIVETFTPGGSGDIVAVRVLYVWDFITPLVGRLFNPGGGNNVLLVSTTVFRSEPYEGL